MMDLLKLLENFGWNWIALILVLLYFFVVFLFSNKPKILNTIPGFCTGIGVLLTFVVLYYNLQNFSPPDSAENSFLITLVRDLTSAFSTSIIGIFFSLIFNPIVKWKIQRIESKALSGSAQKHPQLLMEEMIAGIRQNNELMSVNSKQILSMTSTLESLVIGIEHRMDTMFNKLGKTLTNSIENLNTLAVESATKNAQEINEKFINNSESILQLNGQKLAKATEANQESLNVILAEMKEFTKLMKDQMEETKNYRDQSNQAINALTNTVNDLSTNAIASATKNAQEINEKFINNSESILQLNGEKLAEATEANQESLSNILEEMRGFAALIKNQMEETKKDSDQSVKAIAAGFESSTSQMTSQFDSRATELAGSLEGINKTISGFNEKLQQSTTKILEDNLTILVKSFDKIEKLNESSQSSLNQTTEYFAEAVNQYAEAKDENKLVVKQVKAQVKKNKKQQKQMEELLNRWHQLSEDVNTMQNRVADIANTISNLHAIKEDIEANSSNRL